MISVKICGVRDEVTVAAAVGGGAAYVGFNFFPPSPRYVSPERAGALARAAGEAQTVAVMVDPRDDEIEVACAAFAPDWIQLHGAESPGRVVEARRYAKRGVIKALQIAGSADLVNVAAYAQAADMIMFDAKAPPGADRPGGHGAAFDWKILKNRQFGRPWLLAGGLDPANVARAISESGASIVDVSSGVESAPGIKDGARIAAFLAAARPL